MLITHLIHHITTTHSTNLPQVIVGLDARGFLLGPIIAMRLGASFVPVRKGGKLPGQCEVVKYEKEYGFDSFEMQSEAIQSGQRCIVIEYVFRLSAIGRNVDLIFISDLIATGGSAAAAGQLIAKAGGKTLEYLFIVGLPFLKGEEKLDAPAYSMIQAED